MWRSVWHDGKLMDHLNFRFRLFSHVEKFMYMLVLKKQMDFLRY